MKTSILTFVLAMAASAGIAQTTKTPAPAAKPAASAKAPTSKAVASKPAAAKPAAPKKAVAAKSKAKPVEAAASAVDDEADVGVAELAIAERVHVGMLPCELGNSVQLMPDTKRNGYFDLQVQKMKYRLVPVPTTTGAIRLEDAKSGVVWLQLSNKSMLMNHKLGQRMADDCKSPQQIVVTEQFRLQPPPSVLDAAPAPASAPASSGAGMPVASDSAAAASPRLKP